MTDIVAISELEYWHERAAMAQQSRIPLQVSFNDARRMQELKSEVGLWLWRSEKDTFLGCKVEIIDC